MAAIADDTDLLVLWDIDGTLVRTGNVGAAVLERAFTFVLGALPTGRVQMSGKTDPQIVAEYFEMMGVEDPDLLPSVLERAEIELALAAGDLALEGTACLGAREVLEQLGMLETVKQSLVTGNLKANARVKLAAFNLDVFLDFEIGAFGSDHADRNCLVPIALERAAELRGRPYGLDKVWVIGDTPSDLACARAGGVQCLLVATGRFSLEELTELQPEAVLADLADTTRVLQVMGLG